MFVRLRSLSKVFQMMMMMTHGKCPHADTSEEKSGGEAAGQRPKARLESWSEIQWLSVICLYGYTAL